MIGQKIAHYEITASLGKGGMGEVWLARDTALERDVAIKMLPESFLSDAHRVARFEQEAKTLAALNHPNIAQIYGLERGVPTASPDAGSAQSGAALVMELVDGPTLADRIARGAIPVDEAVGIALQITAALEAAHAQGIVHRDLKPANIKLRSDGTVKVLDFGIAKSIAMRATSGGQPAALTSPSLTEAGVVLGTAAYMSPEQARGKSVDKRADVWAFGCLLYEMLSGQAAFLGEDVTTTLARVIEREPDMRALPPGLPPSLQGTLVICLQKNPEQRLHDIGDVRLALGGGLAALAPGGTEPGLSSWRRAMPVAAALVAGIGVTLIAVKFAVDEAAIAPVPVEDAAPPLTTFEITPPASAPLASLGGYDATISPDGRRIAYFAEDPSRGSVELYVRDLDQLEARRVPGTEVTNTSGGNMNPFFSPDGRFIGYFAPDRGVMRVSVDGAPPVRIMDPPEPVFLGATWDADNTLVYSTGRSIERISVDGSGMAEPLSGGFNEDTFIASPVPLPGGRSILYGEIVNEVEYVAVLDLASGESKRLLEGAQNATYAASGHIVYARGTTLMAAPFDISELVLTGEPVAVLQNVRHPNSLSAADYAVAANGTLIYVPGGGDSGGLSNVYWIDRQGNIVGDPIAESLDAPRDPRLSPDGRRLLLTVGPITDAQLWIYDLGGRPPIPLPTNDSSLGVWSPDGSRIAYAELDGSATLTVRIIAADGTDLASAPLAAGTLDLAPADWSVDDELILVRNLPTPDLVVARATSAEGASSLIETSYYEFDAALSPDNRWLAYTSDRTGGLEVWVQAYPDGVPIRVSSAGGWEPRWSRDGAELYFLQRDAVMATRIDTTNGLAFEPPEMLFRGTHSTNITSNVNSYDVAADGRFVMIQAVGSDVDGVDSDRIVVVENWTEELTERAPSGR